MILFLKLGISNDLCNARNLKVRDLFLEVACGIFNKDTYSCIVCFTIKRMGYLNLKRFRGWPFRDFTQSEGNIYKLMFSCQYVLLSIFTFLRSSVLLKSFDCLDDLFFINAGLQLFIHLFDLLFEELGMFLFIPYCTSTLLLFNFYLFGDTLFLFWYFLSHI